MIKHGKIYFSWLILLVLFPLDISSQVRTSIVGNQKEFLKVVGNHNSEFSKTVEIERPNVESKLKEDELNSSGLARYAIEVETDLTVVDGTFSLGKNFTNWKIKIVAKNATSINVILRDVVLPKGAQIYMYSLDKRMISGPILSQNLFKGKYMSDMLYGDELMIEVIIPNKSNYQEFSISIPKIMYGIKSNTYVSQTRAYGDSQPCNVDINCTNGNGWEDVRDGVALLFASNGGSCSGSLVSDQCQSGRPYFLTAFHCFDDNNDNNLSNQEQDRIGESTYRFLYENDQCNGTTEPTSWFSISGAEFRSGWSITDFALVELSSIPNNIPLNQVNFSGITPFSVGCIHHPQGDVKKVSTKINPSSNVNFWTVDQFDVGLIEPGSSGAPLFDFNHRIIGQVSGGDLNLGCASNNQGLVDNNTFGRVDVSWNGGGLTTNSLQPWLGNSIPQDVNIPDNIIDSLFNISGPDILCEGDQRTFCISPFSGLSGMTWSVEPTDFFSSNTTGSGNCATLKVKDDYSGNGMATLTFSGNFPIYGTCGISSTLTKEIWIGKPPKPRLDLPDCFNPMTNIYIGVTAPGASTFDWHFPSCSGPAPIGDPDPDCWFNYNQIDPGLDVVNIYVGNQSGLIGVTATNECGSSSTYRIINFCNPPTEDPSGPNIRSQNTNLSITSLSDVQLFPNPAYSHFILKSDSPRSIEAKIFSSSGKLQKSFLFDSKEHTILTSDFQDGVYFVHLSTGNEIRVLKLIVIN